MLSADSFGLGEFETEVRRECGEDGVELLVLADSEQLGSVIVVLNKSAFGAEEYKEHNIGENEDESIGVGFCSEAYEAYAPV